MKRIIALLVILSLVSLMSCSPSVSSEEILMGLCASYPIDSTVYSSLASQGAKEYIDAEMLKTLYRVAEAPCKDFSIVLYGKVSTVREIGVFVTHSSDERLKVLDIAGERVAFLRGFAEGETFVRKYKSVIVYGFVDDAERVVRILEENI